MKTILLEEYDDNWPARFEREAARVRAALGERVLDLEHVGSTAVPGLRAKPIVDIVLAVSDSSREPDYAPPLAAAGYRLAVREPEWRQHRMFKGPEGDVNLHVFSAGCPEIERMRRFRDHLRADPADRELYGRTKSELAAKKWGNTQAYADAKTAVVAEILARAGCKPE